jgi:hypothetical protein
MALVYYCNHTGIGFNGGCDCIWERKRKRKIKVARFSRWLHRRQVNQYARFGYVAAPEETFKELDQRVDHALRCRLFMSQ